MAFLEDLAIKTATLQGEPIKTCSFNYLVKCFFAPFSPGYAIATWGLVGLMVVGGLVGTALALHWRQRRKREDQAMEGRWVGIEENALNNIKI